jgi:hypothetical protein
MPVLPREPAPELAMGGVRAGAEREKLEHQERAPFRRPLHDRLRHAHARRAEREEAVRFRREARREAPLVQLREETRASRVGDRVRERGSDGRRRRQSQTADRRLLAIVSRSTRIDMKARSKRCWHVSEALARSSQRIVMTREGASVTTSALRSFVWRER